MRRSFERDYNEDDGYGSGRFSGRHQRRGDWQGSADESWNPEYDERNYGYAGQAYEGRGWNYPAQQRGWQRGREFSDREFGDRDFEGHGWQRSAADRWPGTNRGERWGNQSWSNRSSAGGYRPGSHYPGRGYSGGYTSSQAQGGYRGGQTEQQQYGGYGAGSSYGDAYNPGGSFGDRSFSGGFGGYGAAATGYGSDERHANAGYWTNFRGDEGQNWFERAGQRVREFFGKGPKGYKRSDERIREDVSDRLSEGYLDASDIEVSVDDGEVTLSGSVAVKAWKRLAEDIAEDVIGVTDVHNHIRVRREVGTGASANDASQSSEGVEANRGRLTRRSGSTMAS